MNSCIFYFTDSLRTMTAVVGVGTNVSECEADARAKWTTLVDGRPDKDERAPIVEALNAGLSTELDANNMPGLIL